jgi:hypothetical protein
VSRSSSKAVKTHIKVSPRDFCTDAKNRHVTDIRRRQTSGWSASACWLAARCPGQLIGIRLRVHPPIGSAGSYDANVARARCLLPPVKEGFAASLTKAARGLRSRTRRLGPSWSAWQRRSSSRRRSLLFKRVHCIRGTRSPVRATTPIRWRGTVIAKD